MAILTHYDITKRVISAFVYPPSGIAVLPLWGGTYSHFVWPIIQTVGLSHSMPPSQTDEGNFPWPLCCRKDGDAVSHICCSLLSHFLLLKLSSLIGDILAFEMLRAALKSMSTKCLDLLFVEQWDCFPSLCKKRTLLCTRCRSWRSLLTHLLHWELLSLQSWAGRVREDSPSSCLCETNLHSREHLRSVAGHYSGLRSASCSRNVWTSSWSSIC